MPNILKVLFLMLNISEIKHWDLGNLNLRHLSQKQYVVKMKYDFLKIEYKPLNKMEIYVF